MASSSMIALQDIDAYNLRLLPDWKLEVWHKISMAARISGAFAPREYDDDGMLKPYLPKYQRLFRLIVGSSYPLLRQKVDSPTVHADDKLVPEDRT